MSEIFAFQGGGIQRPPMYNNFNGYPQQQRVPQPFPQMPPVNTHQGPFLPAQFPPSLYLGNGAPYNFDFANNFQNQNQHHNGALPRIPSPVRPAQPNIPSNFPYPSGDNVPSSVTSAPTSPLVQQTTGGSVVDQSVTDQPGSNSMDNSVPTDQLVKNNWKHYQ